MDGWISMSQILVLIYQGLYKNHSFIIRRSWDWIHINDTSIEFGSQSRSWIKIKQKQNKRQKQKQNKNNYTHCDFPGYSKCGKKIYCDFFSTDATHTYDIILNTGTISILIPYSQW